MIYDPMPPCQYMCVLLLKYICIPVFHVSFLVIVMVLGLTSSFVLPLKESTFEQCLVYVAGCRLHRFQVLKYMFQYLQPL